LKLINSKLFFKARNVIKPNEIEINCLKMNIQYNTARNVYYRASGESLKSWSSLAYAYSNIQIKIENDWKMCYLARTEGSKESFIEWAFDFSEKIKVKELRLKFKADCFESGEIKCSILNDESVTVVQMSSLNGDYNIIKNISDLSKFKLRVDMSKGNGSNAFQHTQLFRQKLDDININLLEMDFILQ
jgi:peptide-N4-(N-acetyl-beta-glucosaminyl)asparagine amidase